MAVDELIIAGWAGRDQHALQEHIEELAKLGVKAPSQTPEFYTLAAARLTTDSRIQTIGNSASGEVECVLLSASDKLWVGVGSDHTDRDAETFGITLSKQLCEKPIAPLFWDFAEVEGHWDALELRSYVPADTGKTLYQQGQAAALLPPLELVRRRGRSLASGSVMFCGTLPAIGGIRPADWFEFELHDPVLNRTISHRYFCERISTTA